ncbi:winged helix-turn-helix domain-containing protein [Streptomyces sp. NPDC026673]|uniref:helix-turn-helix domain-containing protein n=1 Tax=Streptomyces sp. NPDC026673 TaxID=3155724 RepID=UPI0033E28B9C
MRAWCSTVPGVCLLLHRHGWSPQVPDRRAVQCHDEAVATWVKETWPAVEPPRRRSGPGVGVHVNVPSPVRMNVLSP